MKWYIILLLLINMAFTQTQKSIDLLNSNFIVLKEKITCIKNIDTKRRYMSEIGFYIKEYNKLAKHDNQCIHTINSIDTSCYILTDDEISNRVSSMLNSIEAYLVVVDEILNKERKIALDAKRNNQIATIAPSNDNDDMTNVMASAFIIVFAASGLYTLSK